MNRYVGFRYFGVVDTDDGVENIVELSNLQYACETCGLHIEGVDTSRMVLEDRIKIYQPDETVSQMQLKMRMLKHIDIKVYKSMITSIQIDAKAVKREVELRLSDFGTSCGDLIFTGNKHAGGLKLRLILDDKCDFNDYTFRLRTTDISYIGVNGIGVEFDLTELCDAKANKAYRTLFRQNQPEVIATVRDIPERMNVLPQQYLSQ